MTWTPQGLRSRSYATLACVGLALAITAASAPAATSCVRGTWTSEPRCRVALHGATEHYPPLLTAYHLFRPDWPLAVNRATGARRWPLRNSLGQPFAWIEQRWSAHASGINKTTAWIVYEADGTTVFDSRRFASEHARDAPLTPYLAIQGYACMLDRAYHADPMVVLIHGDFGDRGRYIGVRGFLDPAAIPAGRGAILNTAASEYRHETRGKTFAQVLTSMHARTGCNQRSLGFKEPAAADLTGFGSSGNLLDPQFQWFYHYNGRYPLHEHAPRAEPSGPGIRRVLTNPAENLYANYATWPLPPVDAVAGSPSETAEPAGAQAKVEATTTGIGGGGIVRAIVPINQGYTVEDWFGYRDPNGYCGRPSNPAFEAPAPVARWALVAIAGTPLEGWVPQKLGHSRYDANGCGG